MRNEAKREKELRIPLRCRAANVHHASSGEWGPVCVHPPCQPDDNSQFFVSTWAKMSLADWLQTARLARAWSSWSSAGGSRGLDAAETRAVRTIGRALLM